MLTIHFHKGLPASGKTTAAERMVRENPGAYVRVNKDDLRAMLHAGHFSKGNEQQVLRIRDQIILDALMNGKHVIVDDTNLDPKHRARIDEIAAQVRKEKGSCAVEEHFFDVPVEECIARDKMRVNGVGEEVIRNMYDRYLRPKSDPLPIKAHDPALPHCIIVDIDGTLARRKDRGPFEWGKVGQDDIHNDIKELIDLIAFRQLAERPDIILCSGRDEVCRPQTEQWLQEHGIRYNYLHMRPTGNREKDTVIKSRMYHEHIEGKYNVDYVLDDRDQVVRMWRSLGLRCLQVAEGNF